MGCYLQGCVFITVYTALLFTYGTSVWDHECVTVCPYKHFPLMALQMDFTGNVFLLVLIHNVPQNALELHLAVKPRRGKK